VTLCQRAEQPQSQMSPSPFGRYLSHVSPRIFGRLHDGDLHGP
jgi:hypothetical protein